MTTTERIDELVEDAQLGHALAISDRNRELMESSFNTLLRAFRAERLLREAAEADLQCERDEYRSKSWAPALREAAAVAVRKI